jgi:archaetidylinositol phosphate synthase
MQQHKAFIRIHQSWLAGQERLLLTHMASMLPARIMPDHLTLFGLAGSVICGAGFALSSLSHVSLWFAALGLCLNWAGDSLDGNLARLRNIERPHYGFFVDHTSDIVSQTFIFMGIALSPNVRFETGSLLLMSYWLAAMLTFIRTISARVFQISYFGIGPTEIRIGLLAYVLSLLTVGPLPIKTRIGVLSLMDTLAIIIFAVVIASFIVLSIWEARRLAILDIVPGRLTPRHSARDLVSTGQAITEIPVP